MAYDNQNQIVQEITGSSKEDCTNKLFKMYNYDYKILHIYTDFRQTGFFHLKKKPVTVVKYTVNHAHSYNPDSVITSYAEEKKKEEDNFVKNQKALLQILQQNQSSNSQVTQITKALEDLKKEVTQKIENISVSSDSKPESLRKIESILEANEFSFSYINMIEQKLKAELLAQDLEDFELVERRTVDFIGDSIKIYKESHSRPPKTYLLIGPTGVGKTTTLVKLAAQFYKSFTEEHDGQKPKICFIDTDNMRVGAKEQLERWGKYMNDSPVYKANKPEDFKEIFENVKESMDAVFIDTSGFSPNDATHIAKMKVFLEAPGFTPDIYLTMMASTKTNDLLNIMRNYEPFGYKSVIITKCDESEQYGNIISALNEKNKTVAYITYGQVAAKDISKANVIDFLIRLKDFKVDRVHVENKFGE